MPERIDSKRKIKETAIKSLADTTLHGISHISRAQNFWFKFGWFVCFLVSSSMCAWYILQSINTYLKYETYTNVYVNHAHQLPFPVISVCPRSFNRAGFNRSVNIENYIYLCLFLQLECDYNDWEYYEDSAYATCARFNSGKAMNGSSIPMKYVTNRGSDFSLYFRLKVEMYIRIWITNETIDLSQTDGIRVACGPLIHAFDISKSTVIKQPKPYSDCTNGLDTIDGYDSDMFKRVFKQFRAKYKYDDCVNLCKQKNFGEKCQLQVEWNGPFYYNNLTELTYGAYLANPFSALAICYGENINPSDDYYAQCDCPVECRTDKYTFIHSFANNLPGMDDNFSSFEIFYDDLKETISVDNIKVETPSLVANIGGILGLFTGFSFLSMIEIVDFLFKIIIILLNKNVAINLEKNDQPI